MFKDSELELALGQFFSLEKQICETLDSNMDLCDFRDRYFHVEEAKHNLLISLEESFPLKKSTFDTRIDEIIRRGNLVIIKIYDYDEDPYAFVFLADKEIKEPT